MVLSRIKFNHSKVNLFLDLLLVLVFMVELEERFTGLRNHELLGLFFGTTLLIHIILHWGWIISLTRKLFTKILHESRLNYVLNLALFADMAAATITGILISRTLGLNLGQFAAGGRALQQLHIITSELSLIIVGLHVAMHWKWIVAHSRRYLFNLGWLQRLIQRSTPRQIAVAGTTGATAGAATTSSLTLNPSEEV